MVIDRFPRWAGAAGILGGVLWVFATVVHALRPVGCVGEECARAAMRESGALDGVATLAALLLFAVTGAALVMLVRREGRFGKLGRIGMRIAMVGGAVLVTAGLVQALLFDGDFPLMPYFVIPGIAGLLIGVLLLAWSVLRSGVLPRWAAGSLLLGSLAMVGFNEQTHAAWLGIPFGLAWMAVGYALWTHPATANAAGTAVPQ